MGRTKGLAIAALAAAIAAPARAEEPGPDQVTLKNGGLVRGTIVELDPGRERGKYPHRSAPEPQTIAPRYWLGEF